MRKINPTFRSGILIIIAGYVIFVLQENYFILLEDMN